MRRDSRLPVLCVSGLICLFSQSSIAAPAATSSWYVSYGIGESDSEFKVEQLAGSIPESERGNVALSKSGDTKRLAIGYSVDARISYEAGKMTLDKAAEIKQFILPNNDVVDAAVDVEGYYLAAISKYRATDSVLINGRLGYYMWDMKTTEKINGETISQHTVSDNDFFYGLGMEIGWLGIEYDILKVGGEQVKYTGATLRYRF